MRKAIKAVRVELTAGKKKAAVKAMPEAIKLISRAGGKGLIKPNTASRLVSRMTIAVNGLK